MMKETKNEVFSCLLKEIIHWSRAEKEKKTIPHLRLPTKETPGQCQSPPGGHLWSSHSPPPPPEEILLLSWLHYRPGLDLCRESERLSSCTWKNMDSLVGGRLVLVLLICFTYRFNSHKIND